MKAFRFSLARILEHRRSEEADALQAMAACTARLEEANAALRDAELEYEMGQCRTSNSLEARLDLERWLDRLEDARTACRIVRGVAEGELDAARNAWLEARMRRRAIEVLEEREREAWNEAAARADQRETDDWVGARWVP